MNDFSSAGSAGTALIACERPNLWGRRFDGEGDVRSSEDWMPMTIASYAPMEPPSPQVSVQREGDQRTTERLRGGGSGANRQGVPHLATLNELARVDPLDGTDSRVVRRIREGHVQHVCDCYRALVGAVSGQVYTWCSRLRRTGVYLPLTSADAHGWCPSWA